MNHGLSGEVASVYDLLFRMIEDRTEPGRRRAIALIGMRRIAATMPTVYCFIGAYPEKHVDAYVQFSGIIPRLGFGRRVATSAEIDAWMYHHGHMLSDTYRVCVTSFVQRVLKYDVVTLESMSPDAYSFMLGFLVPIKDQINAKNGIVSRAA